MRYRQRTATGDYMFAQGKQEFLVNSPSTVEQAVATGLGLFVGEFYLNTSYGVAWFQDVVGFGTLAMYDQVIKNQVKNTLGVLEIVSYTSSLDTDNRVLSVSMVLDTVYGVTGNISVGIPTNFFGFGQGGFGNIPFGSPLGV